MYPVAKTYHFTNHHNGATRSKIVLVKRDEKDLRDEISYVSSDNFRPNDFGNGWTTITETRYTGHIEIDIPLDTIALTEYQRNLRHLQETMAQTDFTGLLDFEE